ncbi:MAG: fluoride efflux transporter CrcB [Planctomycetales bacterium]|nr:fluoride efflux transporter CrcB [Planctomycetales bacterium]
MRQRNPQQPKGSMLMIWRELLCVAMGGAAGALSRYAISVLAMRWLGAAFPYGTLLVNVAGCFLLGLIGQYALERTPPAWLYSGLTAGFLGALTTFSTFSYETLRRFEVGETGVAMLNVAANLALGFAAVALGIWMARVADA